MLPLLHSVHVVPRKRGIVSEVYDAHPEALAMAAVAVWEDTGVVIGAVVLNAHDVRDLPVTPLCTCQRVKCTFRGWRVEGNRGWAPAPP